MAYNSANFTTAQTNAVLESAATNQRIRLLRVSIYCHNANTVNVGASVGFSKHTQPVTRHPGIAAGSGFAERGDRQTPLGEGDLGENLVFTCDVPTSGSIQVNYTFEVAVTL